jgi:hypothetical protein
MATPITAEDQARSFLAAREAVDLDTVLAAYDELPPVKPDDLTGDWDGDVILTGHPGERMLGKLRWAGKRFNGPDDVDPMMCFDEQGERRPSDVMGAATLRRVEYRGVVTATMVYDNHPVFDHFRRVSGDMVIGVMDRKGEHAPLVFTLTRRRERAPA